MILDFIVSRPADEQWPDDLLVTFDEFLREYAEVLGQDGVTYVARLDVEGDLWDACYEYQGLTVNLQSFGWGVTVSDRPLTNGMGDPELAKAIRDIVEPVPPVS